MFFCCFLTCLLWFDISIGEVSLQFSVHTMDSDAEALLFLSELQSYLRAEILDSEGLGLNGN